MGCVCLCLSVSVCVCLCLSVSVCLCLNLVMTNLFSSFDPNVRIFSMRVALNWLAARIRGLALPQAYWLIVSQGTKSILLVIDYLEAELSAVFGQAVTPGTIHIYISIFFFILFSNFIGLMPYIFTRTRHLSLTLALSLPV